LGKLGTILSSLRAVRNNVKVDDVKVDIGGGANITAEHFADLGEDSQPLTGDYVALNRDQGTGRETAIGYIDPVNEHKSLPGDKRIYARESEGRLIAEQWLKSDGTIITNSHAVSGQDIVLMSSITQNTDGSVLIENDEGSFIMAANGQITFQNDEGSIVLAAAGDITMTSPDAVLNIASNGDIKGNNILGSFELTPAGNFDVNGLIIDVDGNLSSTGTVSAETIDGGKHVIAKGKELVNHKHNINSGSSAPGPTGGNN